MDDTVRLEQRLPGAIVVIVTKESATPSRGTKIMPFLRQSSIAAFERFEFLVRKARVEEENARKE